MISFFAVTVTFQASAVLALSVPQRTLVMDACSQKFVPQCTFETMVFVAGIVSVYTLCSLFVMTQDLPMWSSV